MNLWAESENLELASTSAEQAQKSGTMRRNSTEQAVLPALRSWLLAEYVVPYCRLLAATRIFRRCIWLDALGSTRATSKKAGASQEHSESRPYIFDALNGAEQLERSVSRPNKAAHKPRAETLPPVLQTIATLADELARESKPITLQGFALDKGKGGSVEKTFVLPKESSVINASWSEAAPALLPDIEQTATIFLLNPLAITKSSSLVKSEIPFLTADELTPLFQRTAPTEVCLLLMHQQVERVFLPALRSPAGAAAFTALLRSDRWKATLAKESENDSKVGRAIDLWLASLQPHFPMAQRITFPMMTGPATVEDAPCSLLFATRRHDSLACMNDAICVYRRRLVQESRRGILNEAWFAAQQAERDVQALQHLSEDTLREGRARLPRRWPDLRQQLLLDRFGQWTQSEYDAIICRLLQADEVRCEWRQANQENLPCRVPGHEDMLLWQWKKRRY